MAVRVLVVDDSRFFRRRVTEMLESDSGIKVIGSAENGAEAVKMAKRLKPDVITMDVEMPVMNGIDATREIMKASPTAILMFSSLTTDGAKATLDALEAGAVDFLPKRFEEISKDKNVAQIKLCELVNGVSRRRLRRPLSKPASIQTKSPTPGAGKIIPKAPAITPTSKMARGQVKLVAIGTSTGGPVALMDVLKELPENFPLPILLVQHMPGSFTNAFAQRLNSSCAISVKEAEDGDMLKPGLALLAPGGKQMIVDERGGLLKIRITESEQGQNYKPSVDTTFTSIANVFAGKVLAIILTGMGADGREGARLIKQKGSHIWAQDEETSVVYGMPAAIVDAGLADEILPLGVIGSSIATRT